MKTNSLHGYRVQQFSKNEKTLLLKECVNQKNVLPLTNIGCDVVYLKTSLCFVYILCLRGKFQQV